MAALLHAGLDICVSLSDNTDSITTSQRLEESREGDGGAEESRERDRGADAGCGGSCEIRILLLRKESAFNLAVAISEVWMGEREMAFSLALAVSGI